MTINVKKLDELIELRSSKQKVADKIGINRSTFYRKMNGKVKGFSIEEAQKIADVVPLTNEEAIEIFFGEKVAKTLLCLKERKEVG